MKYRVRFLLPKPGEWRDVEAKSVEDAIGVFHVDQPDSESLKFQHDKPEGGRELVFFALVEVEGHEPLVSRVFQTGIWRSGGVRRHQGLTLADIARALGYTHPPETLLEDGWDGEETFDDAWVRRDARYRENEQRVRSV